MFTVHFSAAISRNHIRLTNTSTGETIARTAPKPFSSGERMIDDPKVAASLADGMIRTIEGRKRSLRFFPRVEVTILGEPNTRQDVEEIRRLFTELGFVRVRLK